MASARTDIIRATLPIMPLAPATRPKVTVEASDQSYQWLTEDQSFWKFKHFKTDDRFTLMNSPIKEALSFYFSTMSAGSQAYVYDIIKPITLKTYMDDTVIRYFKEITSWVKTNSTKVEDLLLVDLHTLYGYAPKFDDSDSLLISEVTSWVQDLEPKNDHLLKMFHDLYDSHVNNLFDSRVSSPDSDVPVMDEDFFVKNRWIYATQGTGSNSSIKPDIYKDLDQSLKTKTTLAYTFTDQQMYDLLFTSIETTPAAFIKADEVVKLRAVISADEALTVKMLAALEYMKHTLDLSQYTDALRPSAAWSEKVYSKWDYLYKAHKIPLAIDRSHFDWRIYQFQYLKVLRILRKHLMKVARTSSERSTIDKLMSNIILDIVPKRIAIRLKDGTIKYVKYKNGLLSGWGMTLFLDTVISLVDYQTAKEMVKILYDITIFEDDYKGKGDDQLIWVSSLRGIPELFSIYTGLGFEVNPGKFSIGKNVEFLRMVQTPQKSGVVFAYPSRMVKSILYRKPGYSRDVGKTARMNATIATWTQYTRRLLAIDPSLSLTKIRSIMLSDLYGLTRLPRKTLLALINLRCMSRGYDDLVNPRYTFK